LEEGGLFPSPEEGGKGREKGWGTTGFTEPKQGEKKKGGEEKKKVLCSGSPGRGEGAGKKEWRLSGPEFPPGEEREKTGNRLCVLGGGEENAIDPGKKRGGGTLKKPRVLEERGTKDRSTRPNRVRKKRKEGREGMGKEKIYVLPIIFKSNSISR